MTSLSPLTHEDPYGGPPRRRRSRVNWPVTLAVLVLAVLAAAFLLRPGVVSDRTRDDKVVRVVLPPPPPPPPPEVKPAETPPEPSPTPLDQPVDAAPPPPDAPAEPTAGDNALTAREGAGPSNYGLAAGDGSGARIGGRPGGGGGGYGAYGGVVRGAILRRLQGDPATRDAEFGGGVNVWLDAGGRIERAALVRSTGDAAMDAALVRLLRGVDVGQPPPAGMPQPIRLRIGARSGR